MDIKLISFDGDIEIDGRPLADCINRLGDFAGRVMGQSATTLGGILGDLATEWRYRNLLRIADSFEDLVKRRKAEGRLTPLPPKLAIPLLEAASLEDEVSLQNMWAALLAGWVDGASESKPHRLYIETLRQMDALDARLLDFMTSIGVDIEFYSRDNPVTKESRLNLAKLVDRTAESEESIALSLQNMFRLGLIIDSWMNEPDNMGRGFSGFRVNNPESSFRPSDFGRRLRRACSIEQ